MAVVFLRVAGPRAASVFLPDKRSNIVGPGTDLDPTGEEAPEKTVVRLTRRPQFLFVRSGQTVRKKTLLIQARRRTKAGLALIPASQIGEGFTATKKIGNAVTRNRAKRRLRAASQSLLPRLGVAGVDYVFVARRHTGTVEWASLLDDMESALVSLGAEVAPD